MLTEKLAQTLTEEQLKKLIKQQGAKANRNLINIRKKGADKFSGVMQTKVEPYLRKHGRQSKNGLVYPTATQGRSKQELVNQLLNIQYFNSYVGTVSKIIEKASKLAEEYNIEMDDVTRLWDLVKYGYQSVGYKVDSDVIIKIVRNRIRAGQDDETIKNALREATEQTDNATDMLTHFAEGGVWI